MLKHCLRLKKAIRYLAERNIGIWIFNFFTMIFVINFSWCFIQEWISFFFVFILSFIFQYCTKYAKDGFRPLLKYISLSLFFFSARRIFGEGLEWERGAIFPFPLRSRVSLLEFPASASLSNFRTGREDLIDYGTSVRISCSCLAVVDDSFRRKRGNAIFSRRTRATESGHVRTEFGCHKYVDVRRESTACARRCRPFNLGIDAPVAKRCCSLRDTLTKPKISTDSCCSWRINLLDKSKLIGMMMDFSINLESTFFLNKSGS